MTSCDDGVVGVSEARCEATPPGGCTNPVLLPGHCCPVCPQQKCELGGRLLEDGETKLDPKDTCRECTCREGFLTCSRKTCPVLSCPEHLHKTNPRDCCPSCARQTQIKPDSRRCLWRNKYHEVGASLLSDTCTSCTCPKSLLYHPGASSRVRRGEADMLTPGPGLQLWGHVARGQMQDVHV